jgi:hypothetical protein
MKFLEKIVTWWRHIKILYVIFIKEEDQQSIQERWELLKELSERESL